MSANTLLPTNYNNLAARIDGQVRDAQRSSYDACAQRLAEQMREIYPALTREGNPVAVGLSSWDEALLRFVIREYSAFSNAAIHMFLDARIRNHWPALTAEIIHNMDEEMGALTSGVPHLELMRHGYRVELGIETEDVVPTAATIDFISRMARLFCDRDNTFLAGVLLAFETTAVDEFRIIDRLLRRYRALSGGVIADHSLTGEYIAGHVSPNSEDVSRDPEMAHYEGMVRAVGAHMDGRDLSVLARGFHAVCLELNGWWEQLPLEALRQRARDCLATSRPTAPDIYPSLLQAVGAGAAPVSKEAPTVHAPVA